MELIKTNINGVIEGFCLVKSAEKKQTVKKTSYLDLVLSDAGGEVSAKLWDYSEARHGEYVIGMLVKVRGTVETWNNSSQLRIERIRQAKEEDNVHMEDFVSSAPYPVDWMMEELRTVVEGFSNEHLRAIIQELLTLRQEKLSIWPAAVKMHHAMRGGLLYHTLSILRAAQRLCPLYPFLNVDLVYAGIILHDLSKLDEIDANPSGAASGYTVRGMLLGHLAQGVAELQRVGDRLNTPLELLTMLQHIVFSHHGIPEYGSPVPPMFPEAEMVSQLDTLDATMYEMNEALSQADPGEFTAKIWGLDRRLYRHEWHRDGQNACLDCPRGKEIDD